MSEWAEQNRRLSSESAAEPGPWRNARVPYLREIMDTYNDPLVREVWVMKSAQVGYTEALLNIKGYAIDRKPGPMLSIQPTLEMAKAWSKDRLAPMLEDSPALREKVEAPKARSGKNTTRHKGGPGWRLTIATANSPAGLRSRSVRDVFADEVDGYPPSAGSEGDPINLGRKRQVTFWNRKFYAGSTPTIKGRSRIEKGFESTDMRFLFLPCPHCTRANGGIPAGYQKLVWERLKWSELERVPRDAAYQCEHCGTLIEHHEKTWMLANYEWRATRPFDGRAGFHLSELYSPFVTWGEMAESFVEARKLPETFQTFVNTSLGETFEDWGETVEPEGLAKRKEPYGLDSIPAGVLLLTVGADVQDDRVEFQLEGWGADQENWIIEQHVERGNPGSRIFWRDQVDPYFKRRYVTEDGHELVAEAACIDTGGHHTQAVADYCGPRKRYRIWAVKGQAGASRLAWPMHASRMKKSRTPLFMLGVDTIKSVLYGRLERVKRHGPGYIHLPDSFDERLCAQLTSEKRTRRYVKNRPVYAWEPKAEGAPQEAQDCWVYGYAAMLGRGGSAFLARRAMARARAEAKARGEPMPAPPSTEVEKQEAAPPEQAATHENAEQKPAPAASSPPEPPPAPPPRPRKRRIARPPGRGGWVNRWKS